MGYSVIIKEEAHADILYAYLYYEEQLNGLGERFLELLLKRFDDISRNPKNYSYILEDSLNELRDVKVDKFPFLVIYEIAGNEIFIYAVHNTNKRPWKKDK